MTHTDIASLAKALKRLEKNDLTVEEFDGMFHDLLTAAELGWDRGNSRPPLLPTPRALPVS